MKNLKNVLLIVVLLIGLTQTIKAQTNVSGGIYSNTIWTVANSPYIIIGNVVVFPGVTLTIEPGVIVKFNDNIQLEIRQGQLLAFGAISDSIVFTSNSLNPSVGSWNSIYINDWNSSNLKSQFNYCKIDYASSGISIALNNLNDTIIIKNSNFTHNITAVVGGGGGFIYIDSCNFQYNNTAINGELNKIYNSNISDNQYGISAAGGVAISNCKINSNSFTGISLPADTIISCEIKYNGIGINETQGFFSLITKNIIEQNEIGFKIIYPEGDFICNMICNNTTFDIDYEGQANVNLVINNYWCTTDSAIIASHIYDGYDNVNFGLVTFMPLDTSQCYLTTGIKEKEINNISFNIFPNPAYDKLTLILPKNNLQTEVKIYNLIGQLEIISKIENTSTELNILKLTNGIYIIELTINGTIIRKKFIKQ